MLENREVNDKHSMEAWKKKRKERKEKQTLQ
jgi:hypothetical protein